MNSGPFPPFSRLKSLVVSAAISLLVAGCGGGGGGGGAATDPLGGWAVDGPMLGAGVAAFTVDVSQANGQSASSVASGSTSAATGEIGTLALPQGAAPFILVVTSGATTTDLTTGAAPYFTSLRTAATQSTVTAGSAFQANPLTDLAVEIAVADAITAGSAADFDNQLAAAASLVMSTFGYPGSSASLPAGFNLYTSPTVITAGMTAAQQQAVAFYRSRVELLSAMVKYLIDTYSIGASPDAVLAAIAADLNDDGILNGSAGGLYTLAQINDALGQSAATLVIPGTMTTVDQLPTLLITEATTTSGTAGDSSLNSYDPDLNAQANSDLDGDGIANIDDPLPNNGLPTSVADSYGPVDEGGTLNISAMAGVLANDSDDGITMPLHADLVSGPSHAAAFTLNASGSFDYTHDGGETTSDSFTYKPNDGEQDGATVTVTISITPVNDAPVATADSYGPLAEGGTLNVNAASGVLANDTDAENDPLTAALVSGPSHAASFTLNADGSFDYTHDGGETTSDSFSYKVNDGTVDGNTVTVNISITPVNDLPLAVADSYGPIDEGATLNVNAASGVLANDSDAEMSALSAVLVSGPSHASAFTLNADGSFNYTHDGSETTADSFTYKPNDGTDDGNTVTVSIGITPVNDAPVANADSYGPIDEGSTLNVNAATGVLANDSDAEMDSLSAVLVSGPSHAASFTLNADGSFDYTHDGSETTADSFTYKVNDGSVDGNTVTVSITITPVNDVPVATADSYGPLTEGGTLNVNAAAGVLANDTDGEMDTLTAVLVSGPSHAASFTLNADGSFDYTHDGSQTSSDSFSYKPNDGTDDGNTVTVTISITNTDDAPVAQDDSYALATLGASLNVPAPGVLGNDSDEESDPMTAAVVSGPSHASSFTLNSDGSFSYTHDGDVSGVDSFTYQVTANGKVSNVATVTIAVNLPPQSVADSYGVSEGGTLNVNAASGVLANDTEPDMEAMTAIKVSDPAHASSFTFNSDGSFSYTHDGSETVTDSFTYKANDGTQDGTVTTVTITVTPVNDVPVATADSYGPVDEGGTLNVNAATGVLANDTDGEMDSLSAVLVSGPSHASSFTLNADGSFDYTHDGSETTADSFTYKPNDGTDDGNTVTVDISITPLNDAPMAVADSYNVNAGQTLNVSAPGVLGNDSDAEMDSITAIKLTDPAHASSFTFNSDGSFSYTHDGGVDTSDSFTYKVNDGSVDGNTVTVTINIQQFPVDLAGVWKVSLHVDSASGTDCGVTTGQDLTEYFGINQVGDSLTLHTRWGQTFTGTITDTTNYPFSVANGGGTEGISGGTYNDGSDTLDGTYYVSEGATCTASIDITASQHVRQRPTGGEQFGGLLGTEMKLTVSSGGSSQTSRASELIQLDVPGAMADADLFLIDGQLTGVTFDPVSGFFSGTISNSFSGVDLDGNGMNDSGSFNLDYSGIVVTDQASDSCSGNTCNQPAAVLGMEGSQSLTINGSSATVNIEIDGYARRVSTSATTQVQRQGNGTEMLFFGLNNPPLNVGGSAAPLDQVVNPVDPAVPQDICNDSNLPYRDNFRLLQRLPRPDMANYEFQDPPVYGAFRCGGNVGIISDGDTVRVDVTDGAVTESFSTTAKLASTPAENPDHTSIDVNGAKPSQSMTGSHIPLFGYFNFGQALPVTADTVTTTPNEYRLDIRSQGPLDDVFGYHTQYVIDQADTNFTIPAGELEGEGAVRMRLTARYDDASGKRQTVSRWLSLQEGFVGPVNVEMDSSNSIISSGQDLGLGSLQLAAGTDPFGLGLIIDTCRVLGQDPSDPPYTCRLKGDGTYGQMDYDTNKLTVTLDDAWGDYSGTPGTDIQMDLTFTDSGHATATLSGGPSSLMGSAQVVSPEFRVRSRYFSNGDHTTQFNVANALYPFFNRALVKDGSDSFLFDIWNDGGSPTGAANYGYFFAMPQDGADPQNVMGYENHEVRSKGAGEQRAAADTYKLVLKDGGGDPEDDLVFTTTYTQPDASAIDPPVRADITLNGTGVTSANTAVNAMDVSANPIPVVAWTSNAAATTEWFVSLRVWIDGDTDCDASNPANIDNGTVPFCAEIRTEPLNTTDDATELTRGGSTWTWLNADTGNLFGGRLSLPAGALARMQIVGRDVATGQQVGVGQPFWVKNP